MSDFAVIAHALRADGRPQLQLGGPEDPYWVGLLVEALVAAGFPEAWTVAGDFTDGLHEAVQDFQRYYGLPADGAVTDVVWDTLAWAITGDGYGTT